MIAAHIAAGVIALCVGAVALAVTKGSPLHRRAGTAFVVAMIVMATSGALLGNLVGGLVPLYLVITAWLTVTRTVAEVRPLLTVLMVVALGTSAFLFDAAYTALTVRPVPDGVPAPPLFLLATVTLIGGVGDARALWVGAVRGATRLARHLWRMTFAMWIATASFFLGQARAVPEPLRKIELLVIPVIVVALLLFYWLARVLIKRERAVAPGVLR